LIPHHLISGPEDAPPLVLSNSLGATLDMWDPQHDALAKRFRVIRYDTRGHGGSEIPPGPYSLDDVGNDVVELLDHLHIERAHFAGLSLGGMTGMWLGANAPERVDRLVLLCTSEKLGPPEMWADRANTVREHGTKAIVDTTLERWFTDGYRKRFDLSAIRTMFESDDDDGYANCCAVIQHMDQTATLANIAAPTLVIAGAQDPATPPEHAERLVAAIPNARLEVLDPGAHLVNVERPEAVTELIVEHLEG
jgi:3-oxoadipate enol-lactonase